MRWNPLWGRDLCLATIRIVSKVTEFESRYKECWWVLEGDETWYDSS